MCSSKRPISTDQKVGGSIAAWSGLYLKVSLDKILNSKLLFHVSIRVWMLDKKNLGTEKCLYEWVNKVYKVLWVIE